MFSKSLKVIILSLLTLSILSLTSIKIDALSESESKLSININETLESEVSFKINYLKVSDVKVFESVSISFPFNDLTNINISNSFSKFDYELTNSSKSVIKINLKDNLSSFNLDPVINIYFKTKSIVSNYYSLKQLYFPYYENDLKLQNLDYEITYPKSFSNNLEVYTKTYSLNDNVISGTTDGAIKVLWGDINNINSEFSVVSNLEQSEDINYLLFNLPFEREYSYEYVKSPSFSYAYQDNNFNNYVLIPIVENEISIESNIYNNVVNQNIFKGNIFNRIDNFNEFKEDIFIDSSKKFYTDTKEFSDVANSDIEKLKLVNDYLKNNLTPNLNEVVNNEDLIWEKLSNTDKFNSFEYCYILGGFAKELNISFQIVYGYLLKSTSTPHFWCEINYESNRYILDPLLEEVDNLSYFKKLPKDRITYGIWSANSESTFLGLSSEISSPITNNFKNIDTLTSINNLSDLNNIYLKSLSINFDENIYLQSGVSNYLKLNVFNPNNFFIYASSIYSGINKYTISELKENTKTIIPPNSEVSINGEINPGIYLIDYNDTNLEIGINSVSLLSNSSFKANIYVNKDVYKIVLIVVVLLTLSIILFKYRLNISKRLNLTLLNKLKRQYTFKTKFSLKKFKKA